MISNKTPYLLIFALLFLSGIGYTENEGLKTNEPGLAVPSAATAADTTTADQVTSNTPTVATVTAADVIPQAAPGQPSTLIKADNKYYSDPSHYTLGSQDVIQIDVQRHPEFSGVFPVNMEGRIQLNFAGDIDVTGLTKQELGLKIKNAISNYVVNPSVTVTIMDYKSKAIYVVGEVGQPGKYFMNAETIPIREALVQAGLPTLSAAMRRCRLITPDKTGKAKIKEVDVYSLLYGGDLTKNLDMHAGDVLYVPATVMAKIVQVINPVTSAVGVSSAGPTGASDTKSAVSNLSGKAAY